MDVLDMYPEYRDEFFENLEITYKLCDTELSRKASVLSRKSRKDELKGNNIRRSEKIVRNNGGAAGASYKDNVKFEADVKPGFKMVVDRKVRARRTQSAQFKNEIEAKVNEKKSNLPLRTHTLGKPSARRAMSTLAPSQHVKKKNLSDLFEENRCNSFEGDESSAEGAFRKDSLTYQPLSKSYVDAQNHEKNQEENQGQIDDSVDNRMTVIESRLDRLEININKLNHSLTTDITQILQLLQVQSMQGTQVQSTMPKPLTYTKSARHQTAVIKPLE